MPIRSVVKREEWLRTEPNIENFNFIFTKKFTNTHKCWYSSDIWHARILTEKSKANQAFRTFDKHGLMHPTITFWQNVPVEGNEEVDEIARKSMHDVETRTETWSPL